MHGDCIAFTGRVARLLPLPAERPAACPFNAAKLPGVRHPHVLRSAICNSSPCAWRRGLDPSTLRLLKQSFILRRNTQVSGFWLRGESLANLALLARPYSAPLLQVCRGSAYVRQRDHFQEAVMYYNWRRLGRSSNRCAS